MRTETMIDVTGVPLEALVRAAYNPSRPQGLGMLHFQPGDLSDEDVAAIVKRGENDKWCAINMDYVKGRSCKFSVKRHEGRLYINNSWYDHSDRDLRNLLSAVGLSPMLLDDAKAAQNKHEQTCFDAAVAFLQDNGPYTWTYSEAPKGMDDILTGFYVGQDRGVIKSDWKHGSQIWELAAITTGKRAD